MHRVAGPSGPEEEPEEEEVTEHPGAAPRDPAIGPGGALDFLVGGGEVGALMRATDWSRTPLGPPARWPQSLKTSVSICLDSGFPVLLWWGPELVMIYNDAYRPILGDKHPRSMGQPGRECWPEIWDTIGPMLEAVLERAKTSYFEDLMLPLRRHGFPEQCYFTFTYSPIRDETGGVGGVFCAVTETTQRVVGERQLSLLRELAARTADARTFDQAAAAAAACLAENPRDLTFAMLYLLDPERRRLVLAGAANVPRDHPDVPESISLDTRGRWPLAEVIRTHRPAVVTDLPFALAAAAATGVATREAVVVPIASSGEGGKSGVLVAGLNPQRPFDDGYRRFADLVARQIAAGIANAQAYEDERKRADGLAELDRAKTTFFSNVSHEFRTPLTLMLGPTEEALRTGSFPPEQLELLHRNELRLLKLVNSLLDFARIEAARVEVSFQPTDLAATTADLASTFRSAVERAGLTLHVDCPPLPEPVLVDRAMWEKIVLNLLSNAFKFTFEGEIAVTLRWAGDHVELEVRDTGTGIPAEQLPRLFERFHRVPAARSRSVEGSGIGLALMKELVRLHGGTIAAASAAGEGSTFTVRLPTGDAHLASDRIVPAAPRPAGAIVARPYVEEALRWLPGGTRGPELAREPLPAIGGAPPATPVAHATARVLVVDDNADMRQYLASLLGSRCELEAVPDGAAAEEAIRRRRPDLVLSDVMMGRVDGFELLRRLRSDPATREIPFILLSARAGEEARIEGAQAGADDYVVKPFAARELLARVATHLELARVRREAEAGRRAAERRYRELVEVSPDAILVVREERVEFANPAATALFGAATAAELLGRPALALFHPGDQPLLRERLAAAAPAGGPRLVEERIVRLDGEARDVELATAAFDDGDRPAVQLILRDVTDRRRAQHALRESEATLRGYHEATAALMTLVELGEDDFFYAMPNGRLAAFFGRPASEVDGRSARELGLGDETVAQWLGLLRQCHATQRPTALEYSVVRDGREAWFHGSVSPLPAGASGRARFAVTAVDVTDRKLAEVALQEADRRKTDFLAVLSHELRNPLAPIRNGLYLLERAPPGGPESARALQVIGRQVQHVAKLVEDLLDISRINHGKIRLELRRIDARGVVRRACDDARPTFEERGVALRLELAPEPLWVEADETRLAQIVANLLSNAVKFTPRSGTVEVALRRRRPGGCELCVRDDGAGIEPHLLEAVFEPFAQAERTRGTARGGMGIGLALVRSLVSLHGGVVRASSAGPGRGAELVVSLPLSPAGAEEPRPEPRTLVPGLAVLIVEDNVDAGETLAELLRLQGHEVRLATDGQGGIAAFTASRPDVLLCDVGLPDVTGYELVARLRELEGGRSVFAVALTGYAQPDDVARAISAGFDAHLPKPPPLDEVDRLLARAAAKRTT